MIDRDAHSCGVHGRSWMATWRVIPKVVPREFKLMTSPGWSVGVDRSKVLFLGEYSSRFRVQEDIHRTLWTNTMMSSERYSVEFMDKLLSDTRACCDVLPMLDG